MDINTKKWKQKLSVFLIGKFNTVDRENHKGQPKSSDNVEAALCGSLSYISVLNFTSTKDPIILSKQTLLNFSEHYCHIISLKIQTEKEIADGGINNLNLNQ